MMTEFLSAGVCIRTPDETRMANEALSATVVAIGYK
jgi:hypothetical protein